LGPMLVTGCSPSRNKTRHICISMCTKYTCIYICWSAGQNLNYLLLVSSRIVLPKMNSKRCEHNTETSTRNPSEFELFRPSIKGTRLLFEVTITFVILWQCNWAIYRPQLHGTSQRTRKSQNIAYYEPYRTVILFLLSLIRIICIASPLL